MSARRIILLATAGVVAVLGLVLVAVGWDNAGKIAEVVSTLAAVAGIGVALWAALPAVSAAKGRRVSHTGHATAGPGGGANSGITGSAGSVPDTLIVEHTGNADASRGGDANTGIQLN